MNAAVHALTGAYATDALDPAERAEFELHLQACVACRAEVAELLATTEHLARAVRASPPTALRDRVLAAVAATRQLAPRSPAGAEARWGTWWKTPSLVAATLLLVVAAGLGSLAVTEHRRAEQAERREAQILAVATDPDRVERSVAVAGGGTGRMIMTDRAAVLRVDGMPRLQAGREYQLWLISGGHARSAGIYGARGRFSVLLQDIEGAEALGISVEPEGGSARPSGPVVLTIPVSA